ncbi:hypothetical protein HDU99_000750 [Rhizoclosmatium hyalinum]|nr:hypothetical protein HDU99_000750 [Rhizoclosmatium hyalinum]
MESLPEQRDSKTHVMDFLQHTTSSDGKHEEVFFFPYLERQRRTCLANQISKNNFPRKTTIHLARSPNNTNTNNTSQLSGPVSMFGFEVIQSLPRDAALLFATRSFRLFAYGLIGVILVLYMKSLGLEDESIGAFLTVTLIGDSVVSLFVTGNADRMGRKFMLILGSVLMAGTGLAFALYPTFRLVVIGTIGVLSPSGNEVGPFVAMETSILSKYARLETRATLFSWYSLVGSFSTAIGSLFAGELISTLTERGSFYEAYYSLATAAQSPTRLHLPKRWLNVNKSSPTEPEDGLLSKLAAYRIVIGLYGAVGIVLTFLFWKLSLDVETDSTASGLGRLVLPEEASESPTESAPLLSAEEGREVSPTRSIGTAILDRLLPGLNFSPDTRWLVIKLSMLFTLDSFGTSIMTGSMLAYWFSYKYNVDEAYLGEVLFVSNILAGFSSLLAGWVSSKVGMVNCMVFTHLPANIMMLSVPFMPNL